MNRELLKALGRCRIIELKMANELLGISEKELDESVEKTWLSREVIKENFQVHQYYSLTEKGEKKLKELMPEFGEIYRGFILEHDLNLMEFYLKRTETEKNSWMTRDDMIKKFKLNGTIDGAFINKEGEIEGIEILSKTAKPSAVERTEAFIKHAEIKKINYVLY